MISLSIWKCLDSSRSKAELFFFSPSLSYLLVLLPWADKAKEIYFSGLKIIYLGKNTSWKNIEASAHSRRLYQAQTMSLSPAHFSRKSLQKGLPVLPWLSQSTGRRLLSKSLVHNTRIDLPVTISEVNPKPQLELKMEAHLADSELMRMAYRHIRERYWGTRSSNRPYKNCPSCYKFVVHKINSMLEMTAKVDMHKQAWTLVIVLVVFGITLFTKHK